MAVSVFDLFSIGIGPSSSHTVGPMRAAARFTARLARLGVLDAVSRVRVELYGSLGATGAGHGTIAAVVLGLAGAEPETVDPDQVAPLVQEVRSTGRLSLSGGRSIAFDVDSDIALRLDRLDFHSNGMVFDALDAAGSVLDRRLYFSIGGGAVLDEDEAAAPATESGELPYPFGTARELVALATDRGCSIATVMADNERALGRHSDLRSAVLRIWAVMQDCVSAGLAHRDDPLYALDWVTVYALAVNEENAAGGRVVTAPTNGAAGVIPAVLHYYSRFVPDACDDGVVRFLLTAAAIGVLFKANASISGAEVGCQGEVGSACSMAAAGLTAVLGGTPEQVENAAEIGIEHNLGLTCDPVGGLVQIPCIERNAVAAVKAITAARMALHGDGTHFVSLDAAIKTMRDTGADMADKYKETALGGLALNVVEC